MPSVRRKIAIFGGTFDPVHLGHLIMAEQCREQAGLDELWFVPAARPPHKRDLQPAPFERRAEMLALAVAGHPGFRVETLEKDRPGPSYTADTLQELTAAHHDVDWYFVLGSDSVVDLPGWYQPQRIVALAHLLIVARPGVIVPAAEELARTLGAAVRMQVIAAPLIGIASTDIRQRAAAGRSVRYLVPRPVEVYLVEKQLYGSGS